MIAPHRRVHRRVFLVLGLLLPVGALAGLSSRPQPVVQRPVAAPGTHSMGAEAEGAELGEILLTDGTRLSASWMANTGQLELQPDQAPQLPSLLLYASSSDMDSSTSASRLPEDAILLGSVGGAFSQRFDWKREALPRSLWIYSLGHQDVVGQAQLKEVE